MTIKRKNKVIIIITALIAAAAAACLFILIRPDFRYIIIDFFRMPDRSMISEISPDSIQMREYTFYELEDNSKVVFDQSLMLINGEYSIKNGFCAQIDEYTGTGVYMNSCVLSAYNELASSVNEKFDKKLYIMSAYRDSQEQMEISADNSDVAAAEGESEHQVGLALDVYVKNFAGYGFLKSDVGQYVNSECSKYGFIIRYPYYGKSETKIPFEPWHIRYVGAPHAEIINEGKMTLEEYIAGLDKDKIYSSGEFIIMRRSIGDKLILPFDFKSAVVSEDNTGNYIITVKI